MKWHKTSLATVLRRDCKEERIKTEDQLGGCTAIIQAREDGSKVVAVEVVKSG